MLKLNLDRLFQQHAKLPAGPLRVKRFQSGMQ
jgi:hypothetical protein